jgi:hypothetical protein
MGIRKVALSRVPTSDHEWAVEAGFVVFAIVMAVLLVWIGFTWWIAAPVVLAGWLLHIWNNGS